MPSPTFVLQFPGGKPLSTTRKRSLYSGKNKRLEQVVFSHFTLALRPSGRGWLRDAVKGTEPIHPRDSETGGFMYRKTRKNEGFRSQVAVVGGEPYFWSRKKISRRTLQLRLGGSVPPHFEVIPGNEVGKASYFSRRLLEARHEQRGFS